MFLTLNAIFSCSVLVFNYSVSGCNNALIALSLPYFSNIFSIFLISWLLWAETTYVYPFKPSFISFLKLFQTLAPSDFWRNQFVLISFRLTLLFHATTLSLSLTFSTHHDNAFWVSVQAHWQSTIYRLFLFSILFSFLFFFFWRNLLALVPKSRAPLSKRTRCTFIDSNELNEIYEGSWW